MLSTTSEDSPACKEERLLPFSGAGLPGLGRYPDTGGKPASSPLRGIRNKPDSVLSIIAGHRSGDLQ